MYRRALINGDLYPYYPCLPTIGLGGCLRVLDMTGCTGVGEFGDRALREIGEEEEKDD